MEGQVIAEVTIIPVGTGDTGLSRYIAACVQVLEKTPDLHYQLTAMGTIIQGPLRQVLKVVQEMHQVPFEFGVSRVVTTIKIDERRDKPQTMGDKVEAVRKLFPKVKV